jgi:excisionase family DNA binding protein
MNTTLPGRFYTVSEVATLLACARVTVWRSIRNGHLPAVRIGHSWRIPASALEPKLQNRGGR